MVNAREKQVQMVGSPESPVTLVMRLLKTIVLSVVLASASLVANAEAVYDEELGHLSASLRSLLIEAERLPPGNYAARLELQRELFDLSKKLHRLGEEARKADLALQRRGNPPDRNLLLAAAISQTLDLSLSLASMYLSTGDRVFWAPAAEAAQAARSLLAQR